MRSTNDANAAGTLKKSFLRRVRLFGLGGAGTAVTRSRTATDDQTVLELDFESQSASHCSHQAAAAAICLPPDSGEHEPPEPSIAAVDENQEDFSHASSLPVDEDEDIVVGEVPLTGRKNIDGHPKNVLYVNGNTVEFQEYETESAIPSAAENNVSNYREKSTQRPAISISSHGTIGAGPYRFIRDEEISILEKILGELSGEDKEAAALASYQYYQVSQGQHASSSDLQGLQTSHALQMIRRHWVACSKNYTKTMRHIQNTLEFRRRWHVNETRQTFVVDTPTANTHDTCAKENAKYNSNKRRQRRIRRYMEGPIGSRLFVRGYDKLGHACIHFLFRKLSLTAMHLSEQRQQRQATTLLLDPTSSSLSQNLECLLAMLFVLEKAIACSEYHATNTDGKITVCVDLKGFQKWQIPPLAALQQLVAILRDHYPERLYRVYWIDAPIVFRYVWAALLKPRIDMNTRDKFEFVTGRFARNRIMRKSFDLDQIMPYQHPSGKLVAPVDLEAFLYQLPFEQPYME